MKNANTAANSAPKLRFFGLGKLKPFIATYKLMFAAMIACTILVGIFNTALPLFQQYAFNNFIEGNTLNGIVPFIILYVPVSYTHLTLPTNSRV